MRAAYHYEKNKDYRAFVDLSKYTGMEIEHGHDTESKTNQFGLHTNPAHHAVSIHRDVDRELRNVRADAL